MEREEKEAVIAALRRRVDELEGVVEQLSEQNKQLRAQLEQAQRAGKRQAAPFSKGKLKENPKKPGRKAGHESAQRTVPDHVDSEVDAFLPCSCPACGGEVLEDGAVEQYQVDIPPKSVKTTRFRIHVGHCTCCGRRVQGRDPQQTSDAVGAAGVQLGPQALALAAMAKHELGVPYGKVQRLMEHGFGLVACRAARRGAAQQPGRAEDQAFLILSSTWRCTMYTHQDPTPQHCFRGHQ